MNEKEILNRLKNSIEQAPIDILEKIKEGAREKMLRHDDITWQDTSRFSFRKLMPYASIAAGFLLVFFGWQYQVRMPDSHIYIDVNPSVEIVTNRQDKVINILADNIDGERIVKNLDYKGKNIYQVTEEVLDRMMDEDYLNKNHEFLLLSVYNKNQKRAEEKKQSLDKKIHDHLEAKDLQPIVLLQKIDYTSTIEEYAKKHGISVSKMTFIRNLIILNPELQTEDLVNLSIENLVSLSQGMGLELDKIIESKDLDRIQTRLPQPELETEDDIETLPKDHDDDYDDYYDDYDDHDDHDDDVTSVKQETKEATREQYKKQSKELSSGRISADKAKSIALELTGGGKIIEFELDDDEYEIEIISNGKEYEIEIDAYTGKVLDFEVEDDD